MSLSRVHYLSESALVDRCSVVVISTLHAKGPISIGTSGTQCGATGPLIRGITATFVAGPSGRNLGDAEAGEGALDEDVAKVQRMGQQIWRCRPTNKTDNPFRCKTVPGGGRWI